MTAGSLQISPELAQRSLPLVLVGLALACRPAVSGTDPAPLGYGEGDRFGSMSGYDEDPVPRAEPTPWTPPTRERGLGGASAEAPSPGPVPHVADVLAVCAHLEELAGNEEERADCLRRQRVARVFRSIGDWKTLAACILASSDAASAAACEAQTPAAFPPDPDYPRESAVCLHVFAMTIIEELGPEPMLGASELLEFQPLLGDCVQAFVEDERGDRNPAEYAELLACMEASHSLAEADGCE